MDGQPVIGKSYEWHRRGDGDKPVQVIVEELAGPDSVHAKVGMCRVRFGEMSRWVNMSDLSDDHHEKDA